MEVFNEYKFYYTCSSLDFLGIIFLVLSIQCGHDFGDKGYRDWWNEYLNVISFNLNCNFLSLSRTISEMLSFWLGIFWINLYAIFMEFCIGMYSLVLIRKMISNSSSICCNVNSKYWKIGSFLFDEHAVNYVQIFTSSVPITSSILKTIRLPKLKLQASITKIVATL